MNKAILLGGSTAFIPTFENAAYGIEWTKDNNDIIRIGNAKFHRELPIQNRLKGCVYFRINFIRNGKAYYADSRDKTLFYSIHKLNHFPINFKITKYD